MIIPNRLGNARHFHGQDAVPEPAGGPQIVTPETDVWAAVARAAQDADPHYPDKFEPTTWWRAILFDYARGVLGVTEIRDHLETCWRNKTAPSWREERLIRELLNTWSEVNFDGLTLDEAIPDGLVELYDEVDFGLASDFGIEEVTPNRFYEEFVKALWRVKVPANEHTWEHAVEKAWRAFAGIGRASDLRAAGVIRDLDIKAPHCQLIVYILFQLSDNYFGNPFPVPQTKLAETVTQLIMDNPDRFKVRGMTQGKVSAFLCFLKENKALAPVGSYVPRQRARFYQWTPMTRGASV